MNILIYYYDVYIYSYSRSRQLATIQKIEFEIVFCYCNLSNRAAVVVPDLLVDIQILRKILINKSIIPLLY